MPISRFLPEEIWGIVRRSNRDEAVVAAEPPPPGVPVETSTDVPCQERLGAIDPKTGSLEGAQTTNAACDVGHYGALIRGVDHEVSAVVEQVGRFVIRRSAPSRRRRPILGTNSKEGSRTPRNTHRPPRNPWTRAASGAVMLGRPLCEINESSRLMTWSAPEKPGGPLPSPRDPDHSTRPGGAQHLRS